MRVLIADDEKNIRETLKRIFLLEGIEAVTAPDGITARDLLAEERFDVAILDLKMPGMSGQEVLEWTLTEGVLVPVVMISAHGEIPDAVQALKSGARDFLEKPLDTDLLLQKIRSLVEEERRKQVVARQIHAASPRREEPFIAVNVGALPATLIESELFGHEKGAFTGADSRMIGLFELAGAGTLFLDEIAEMPPSLQVKLLRVLQDRRIRRIGGSRDIPIRARILSATNRNLEDRVRRGEFREDLFYRLNVIRIDIPLIAEYLLDQVCRRLNLGSRRLGPQSLAKLLSYAYPGNVRELENILERAAILSEGPEILPYHLELQETVTGKNSEGEVLSAPARLEDLEMVAIEAMLRKKGGNRTKAAEALGISRRTLQYKLKKYGLE